MAVENKNTYPQPNHQEKENNDNSVTWQRYNYSPPISSDSSNDEIDEILRTINQKGGKLSGGVQASRFEKPDPNRQ
ncbi:30977_t:CDS:2, partial [Racocetra persica]